MKSRRPALIALAALAVLAGGCARRESPADRAARDGMLLQSLGATTVVLDPHLAQSLAEGSVLRALCEGLVVADPQTLEPRPGVAERWDVSDDGLTYTFHLRAEARWSNGDPVTAEDFVASIRRALTRELGAPNVFLLHVLRGARAYGSGELADFAQVGAEALDARTLRLTLEAPAGHFLTMLTHFVWLPVHLPSLRAAGAETMRAAERVTPERFVGNGAFRLAEYRPQERLRLEPSATYWNAPTVKLRGVTLLAFGSVQTEERAFRAGELHITDALPLGRIRTYRDTSPELLRVAPAYALYFYRFNTSRPPLDDARVRRALALAIDRRALVEGPLAGAHTPAHAVTPPLAGGYEPPPLATHGPELARSLLAEAGFAGAQGMRPVEILFNSSENHRLVAEVVQENWRRELGIGVALANQEEVVFYANRRQLNYDVCRASWFADYLDPLAFLEIFTSGNANNQTGWSNADFDRLVAEARRTTDAPRRRELFTAAETILLQEMPVIPLYVQSTVRLVDPRVQGWVDNRLDLHPYTGMTLAPDALATATPAR